LIGKRRKKNTGDHATQNAPDDNASMTTSDNEVKRGAYLSATEPPRIMYDTTFVS